MKQHNSLSSGSSLLRAVLAFLAIMASALVAAPALAGAGWGDTSNLTPDPSISATDATGALKVRTYYANSPQGVQADVITGGTRDTGTALRKFVDALPGLGGAPFTGFPGNLTDGTYIPVAVGDTSSYPGSVYYEVAVVEYTQRMHTDLAKATTLRGYVQIDPVATDALAGLTGNGGISPAGSKAIPLFQLDGVTPVMISRPSTRPAAVNGFEQVQAVAVDKPSYLGPTIVSLRGTPTRVKFYNGLPAGRGFTDANGIWQRQGDLFIPVDHTLFGGGDGQTQNGFKDLLCGDVLSGPNNAGDTTLSACAGGPNADGSVTPQGYVHVPKFELYTENREELHLHGGDNPWISDGHPHQWITPAADELNPAEEQNYKRGDIAYNVPDMPNPGPGAVTYYWPNGQSGRLLFYHDHATGLTRLNVYAGTAAGYLLVDPDERGINGLVAGEIPLVIQEKTFVPKDIAIEDAKWDTTRWGQEGDLWFPHVYETNQDPLSADATNPVGRWDGASFFWPVFPQNYATPSGEYGNVSTTPEAFMDTPIVNGMAYPTMTIDPKAYRFRILGVGNDRMLNLNLVVADSTQAAASGVPDTEVKMVPFNSPNGPTSVTYACPDGTTVGQRVGDINAIGTVKKVGWTESGPNTAGITQYNISFPCAGGLTDTGWGQADNRPGGVPDPATIGPDIIRIGNEGGLFQQAVVIPTTPINYEYNKRSITVLNVLERGLWLGPAERADVVIDFSQYAGKTLILYNDSGSPVPAGDPRIDYYTGNGDQTGAGGAPSTAAGYGPNTRTIMQIKVNAAGAAAPFDVAALNAQLLPAYVATQPKPVVPTPEYAPMGDAMGFTTTAPYEHIYTGSIYLNKYNALTIPAAPEEFNYTPAPVCSTTANCLTALANIRKGINGGLVKALVGQPVKAYVESKAIQELFEPDYGRMNATLGVELPFTNVTIQTTIPLAYVDPATETIANGETQFWKITHNGVDSHPVHFHFLNVQVINRVGWDGTIKPIPADEVGWKETVKMHPLEDIVVAVRAKSAPPTPFGMPHSYRQPAPNQLPTDNHGITQIDPATGNAPATPYTNAPVDYFSEYVWHCHILGHEENDFMRPFLLKAGEVLAPAFTVTSAASGAAGVDVTWVDPTPVPAPLTAFDVISNPTGFLGNPNNEIGFRVERSPGIVAVDAASFVPVSTGLLTINPITKALNTQANATTYTDTTAGGVVPAAPAAPTVASATDTTVTLNLPALPAGVAGYVIYRDGTLVTPTTVSTPTWQDTGLVAGTSYSYTLAAVADGAASDYTYRVAAVTAAGDTLSTNVATATVTVANSAQGPALAVVTVPAAPTALVFTNVLDVSMTAGWTAAAGADSYDVTVDGGAVTNVTTTTDALAGLTGNTSYTVDVKARNASGVSAAGLTGSQLTLPSAPVNPVVGAITSSSVALSWTAPVGGADTYSVQYSTDAFATFTTTAAAAGTSTTVTGLAPSTTYDLRVVAINATGTSAVSASVNAKTLPALPIVPTNLVFTNVLDVSMTASWTASTGATSYDVTVNGGTASNVAVPSDALAGLSGNTSYALSILARNVTGVSTTALAGSQLTLPSAPVNPVVGAITSSSVALSWTAPVGGAASYTVQSSTNAFASFTSTAAAGTSTTVTGLAAGTAYVFRVLADNATGASAPSATVNATTLSDLPPAPTNLVFTNVTTTTLTGSWTASAGATSYDVTVNGALVNVAVPTRALTGLTANTSYAFSILARNAVGVSATALTGTQLTLPNAPGRPFVTGRTSSSIALTWAAPAGGAAGYAVQYSTNGFATIAGSVASAGTSSTVTGLAAATTYTFRVLATNAAGSSAPSATRNATTLAGALPAPPAPTLGAVTTTTVRFSWAAVPGATNYTLYRNGVAVWTGAGTTRTQGGQVAGNTYGFTLTANNAGGASPQSPATTATTLPARPAAPTVSTVGNTAANHQLTVTVPALPATATAAITYTVRYQYRTAGGLPWGAVTVLQTGIPATAAAQSIAYGMPAAGRYRFSIVAVDAGGSSAASANSAQVQSL